MKTGELRGKTKYDNAPRTIGLLWKGVYNHSDSYPTWLGPRVFKHFAGKSKEELKEMCNELLKHSDWDSYLSGDFCEYCGKRAGHPHSISGLIYGMQSEYIDDGTKKLYKNRDEVEAQIRENNRIYNWGVTEKELIERIDEEWSVHENYLRTGFADPEAKYHQHSEFGEGKVSLITSENPDPLFIEWVYVIDPDERMMHIYAHESGKDRTKYKKKKDPRFGETTVSENPKKMPAEGYNKDGYWYSGSIAVGYRHVKVLEVDISKTDDEPNWHTLEKTVYTMHDDAYEFPEYVKAMSKHMHLQSIK